MLPKCEMPAAMAASMVSFLVTSSRVTSTLSSALSSWSCSGWERTVATTFHPRSWKYLAVMRPMPLLQPVMSMVWRVMGWFLQVSRVDGARSKEWCVAGGAAVKHTLKSRPRQRSSDSRQSRCKRCQPGAGESERRRVAWFAGDVAQFELSGTLGFSILCA